MRRICCIFNYAPHYRAAIYHLMDLEFDCDFYFGNSLFFELKKLDYSKLSGYKGELKTIKIRSFKWHLSTVAFIFRKYDSYLITGDSSYLSYWIIILICKIRKKNLYMWSHGLKQNPKTRFDHYNISFLKRATGGIFIYNDYSKNLMSQLGFSSEKLHVIYNSLSYASQLDIRKGLKRTDIFFQHFGNNSPILMYIGRIQKNKKLDLLIESLMILSQKGVKYNLVIVGEEIEYTGVGDLVNGYGIDDQVWFLGPCYDEKKIGELFFNATVCISPGNIGLTALHSLVYGTPVITHNNLKNQGPEFESIEDGVTGMFFKENSIKDLAHKIVMLVEMTIGKRDEVRRNCYNVIDEKYNPYFQISQLKKVFNNNND